jgi:diguanylate cyclase (GGDEF)-like protein
MSGPRAASSSRAGWWRLTAAATGVFIAAFVAVLATDALGPTTYSWFDNLVQTAAPLAAAAACAVAAARHGSRVRLAWALIGASAFSWGCGQAIWDWYELVRGVLVPFPSFADAGYLSAVPLALAGVLAFPVAHERTTSQVRNVLDGLLIAGALLIVSWNTVLGAVYHAGSPTTLAMVLGLLYPLSDVAVLTVVLLRVRGMPAGGSAPLLLLAAGLVAAAVADSAFAYLTATNTYGAGNVLDAGWVAGYLLVMLAALRGVTRPLRGRPKAAGWSRVRSLLPYPVVAAAMATTVVERIATGATSNFTLATLLAVVALVLARQYLVVGDNARLVRRLRVRERELARQVHYDPLTDLPNRVHFHAAVDAALIRAADDGTRCAVLFIDLDDFKHVNDTLGHAVGDRVLVAVGQRLRSCIRPGDLAARLGGDEFAVLLEHAPDTARLNSMARRVLQALREPLSVDDTILPVRGTLGLAVSENAADTFDELLRRADVAMYAAKREGKDRVGVYQAAAA